MSIVMPMMRGAIATAFVLQCVGVVRVFDIVVAMTGGGPGIATQMPAIYVIEQHHRPRERRPGHGRGHHDAAAGRIVVVPGLSAHSDGGGEVEASA